MRGATGRKLLFPITDRISIHAPHAGGDRMRGGFKMYNKLFQSTPPMRGATPQFDPSQFITRISIHAPHAGGDLFRQNQRRPC